MIEDINLGRELSLGIFIGLLFIILNATFGIAIGIPLLAFSSETERYTIIGGIAPLAEELAFRAILPFALAFLGINLIFNAIINIIAFPLYHYYAYGASFTSASSLFIGAGLFALIAFAATYYNSKPDEFQVPIASTIAHSMINIWLGIKLAGLVTVG